MAINQIYLFSLPTLASSECEANNDEFLAKKVNGEAICVHHFIVPDSLLNSLIVEMSRCQTLVA